MTDKPKALQAELKVVRKEYITPNFIRVFLTGTDLSQFAKATVGVNNKILVPPIGVDTIHFPSFDYETMQWIQPDEKVRPFIRTYTHRGLNLETNELWIDFVAHGDEGPASAWAIRAKEGDVLGVLMKETASDLYLKTDWYLLAGDATALPVLSAILEDLPKTACGVCVIEVPTQEDIQDIKTQADIEFKWLINAHPEKGSSLAETVKHIKLPSDNRFAYVAAEFSTVKEIRNYLRKVLHWTKDELYAYSYWKAGVAEDKSTADRQYEKTEIE